MSLSDLDQIWLSAESTIQQAIGAIASLRIQDQVTNDLMWTMTPTDRNNDVTVSVIQKLGMTYGEIETKIFPMLRSSKECIHATNYPNSPYKLFTSYIETVAHKSQELRTMLDVEYEDTIDFKIKFKEQVNVKIDEIVAQLQQSLLLLKRTVRTIITDEYLERTNKNLELLSAYTWIKQSYAKIQLEECLDTNQYTSVFDKFNDVYLMYITILETWNVAYEEYDIISWCNNLQSKILGLKTGELTLSEDLKGDICKEFQEVSGMIDVRIQNLRKPLVF